MSTTDQIATALRAEETPNVHVIPLEAGNVQGLGDQARRWLAATPRHEIVSLTHAPAVRVEPSGGLAGPRDIRVERGLLLVRPAAA